MEQKIIAVVGVSGNQGGSVARTFLAHPGWKIRGLTRNPASVNLDALRSQGVDLVRADLDDVSSLEAAFRGVHAIFAVTDFWQFVKDPANFEKAKGLGKTINVYAYEREIQQGRNLIDAAAKILAEDRVLESFVLSTLSNSRYWSSGEITENYHFDGKALFTEYLKEHQTQLAASSRYLQMGAYVDNMRAGPFTTPMRRADGSFFFNKISSATGSHPIPWVDASRDTGPFVKALVGAPPGTTMLGYNALLSWPEFLDVFGRATNSTAERVDVTRDQIVQGGFPEFLVDEVIASSRYAERWGWAGGEPGVVGPFDMGVEKSELLDLEAWIKEQGWTSA